MNQTKEDARFRVYNVNGASLSDNPSLVYLRELQWYVGIWKLQIDKAVEEKMRTPEVALIKKAIRLKYASGTKMYWHPDLGASGGWANSPFWIDDKDTASLALKIAKQQGPRFENYTIKLVHLKCKCTTPQLDKPQRYHVLTCPLSGHKQKKERK